MLKTRQFVNKVEAFRELILMVTYSISIAEVIELGNQNTLKEMWKKPKSQNCFKIGILVVDCTLINK